MTPVESDREPCGCSPTHTTGRVWQPESGTTCVPAAVGHGPCIAMEGFTTGDNGSWLYGETDNTCWHRLKYLWTVGMSHIPVHKVVVDIAHR